MGTETTLLHFGHLTFPAAGAFASFNLVLQCGQVTIIIGEVSVVVWRYQRSVVGSPSMETQSSEWSAMVYNAAFRHFRKMSPDE